MCLITNKQPFITNDDIICYKAFHSDIATAYQIFFMEPNTFYSIYYNKKWVIGEIYEEEINESYESRPLWADDFTRMTHSEINHECLPEGWRAYGKGFHSVNTINRAKIHSNVIVKCVIPKGAMVIEDYAGNFISNKIKLLNKVEGAEYFV
jgi:hypothetical protein